MPLESLLTLVEKLRERIDNHRDDLSKNEAQTRYALINPLLRELGWDTENPDLVIPEYKTDDGSADYALLRNGKPIMPIMMVEAKKLDTPLQGRVLTQGLTYCQMRGTNYFAVTDGRSWEIYDPHLGPIPIAEKQIAKFDLKDQSAAEVCRNALALWELRVSGRIGTWQAPGVGPTPDHPTQPESPIPNTQPEPPNEHEWRPISELNPQKGDTSPREVRFPDGSVRSVTAWGWLIVEVTRWLVDGNYLNTSHCPILSKPTGRTHCAVAIEPVHLSRKSFTNPEAVGSLYVETGLGSESIVTAIRIIIKRVDQNPAQFKVRFS